MAEYIKFISAREPAQRHIKKIPIADSRVFMPMLDLFQQLRDAGMKLTLQDYELLRQSLGDDYEATNWEDLRDICRLLWVKPSLNYDRDIFDREFDRYQAAKEQEFDRWLGNQQPETNSGQTPSINFGVLPQIPPRKQTLAASSELKYDAPPIGEGVNAVKKDRPKSSRFRPDFAVQVPISQTIFQQAWRSLRRPISDLRLSELDVLATVERIGQEGFFRDIVTRPLAQKKAELLRLVDDSNAMLPFMPVMQPLVDTVLNRRIAPALIYRFNQYPTNYLYQWQHPLRGVPLDRVLGRLNRQRTVVIILSEAGAASPLYHQERVIGTGKFLERLLPCVREVLWLNPLPYERWANTTATAIQVAMAGRMVPFEIGKWQQLSQTREFRSGVQLWSLMQTEILRSSDSGILPNDKLPYLPKDMDK
ncbi:hypothetical protein [Chamaesiphon sp. OTE_75_metabat_556]|uniref:hypothetical protein n=1 Tax=Chamaesiphon sp. OTE_75_metabat_556 TaxID=2964692 RepID=UPI00286AA58C|nr:hypothetical protein [Chamaesiphon sp. OTE_75_metabat_556]